jgi:hypothetical protein
MVNISIDFGMYWAFFERRVTSSEERITDLRVNMAFEGAGACADKRWHASG